MVADQIVAVPDPEESAEEAGLPPVASRTQAKHTIVQAIATAAAKVGNTPAVCRKCYDHPAVLERSISP
jgi:DNA topoisomerase IB